jgi:GH15 family glucan-1,4-alpha-glucosidase
MWDVTTQFAALWGFPDYPMLSSSIEFFEKNCVKLDGGFQYFEAMDPGISGYGGDVFFFTTASMAQYYCLTKTPAKALPLIRWMVKNSNCYGLMPERIYLDNSDCSDASPLSWCNAEFALAVYQYSAAGEK